MTITELRKDLDPRFQKWLKKDLVAYLSAADPRERVGGPKGKGRLTAKKALALLASK